MSDAATSLPFYYKDTFGGLFDDEYLWRNHQKWLAERGYMLRPRYREDWEPSWLKTGKRILESEDGLSTMRTTTMDAVRTSDGRIVSLKCLRKSRHPDEERIIRLLTHPKFASEPDNHSVPVYDILQSPLDPDQIFIVMPYLMLIDRVDFATVGEAVECFRQLFAGLQFIHSCRVAHCDVMVLNVMMDPTPLFSEIPHPTTPDRCYDFKHKVKRYTRTERPTRYYYIDFGLSIKFSPGQDTNCEIVYGGDRSAPEYNNSSGLYNPFYLDIYTLANMIREEFIDKSPSFDFMKPLINDMMKEKPGDRPNIEEVVERFETICASLSWWRLRSRFVYRNEITVLSLFRSCRHLVRTIAYMVKGIPALPSPRS